jgi:SPP1 gp7 family putative phage head morphogenesis protein
VSTPSSLYRNAIDLNRYSNSVARRLINAYNDIIIDAVNQLQTIDEATAPVKAARLRAILAQLKTSLATWAGDATELTAQELQGLALLQSEFVTEQLRAALPAGARDAVRTVEISPQFAQSVVTTDPTQLNVVTLSDDLYKSVYGAEALARQAGTGTYSLTATQGTMITLPNGQIVEKAFRGIAEAQAERFSQAVRNGLLTGETTQSIAKRLVGRLEFGDTGPLSVRQLQAAGGELTTVANHQVMTLVRTSINQVANTASQQVYEANQDITKKYRYVATLDTRTSAICRANDGREFEYGKGPTPPLHFACRSTTVPVIDYEGLGFSPPPPGKRASMKGQVPADTSYGEWLYGQPKTVQEDVLGSKTKYFQTIVRKDTSKLIQQGVKPDTARKRAARDAMAKLVRDDGSELTLEQLRKRYGPAQP